MSVLKYVYTILFFYLLLYLSRYLFLYHPLFFSPIVFPSVLDLGHAVSWLRHYATSRKVAGSNPYEVDFFNLPNPSSRNMALGSTQPLTEKSTRNLPGAKGLPARKADNPTAIHEPIV
jgi:hypothetical protein